MTRIAKRLAQEESGFTLIEVLIAAIILVIGLFALVTSVDASRRLTNVAEHETVASQVADRELDLATTLPYDRVALSSTPACSASPCPTNTANDNDRWNAYLMSSNLLPQPSGGTSCSSWTSANAANAALNQTMNNEPTCIDTCPSVVAASGCPAIGSLSATSNVTVPTSSGNSIRLKVYRYVTWVNDTACGSACPNIQENNYKGDYKRVTIAVLPVSSQVTSTTGLPSPAGNNGPRQPVIVSAVRPYPDRGPQNNAGNQSPCSGAGVIQC